MAPWNPRALGEATMTALMPLPASNLLASGRVLLFLPSLVAAIGLNEAIVLQQLRYHLDDERRPRIWRETCWVRASVDRWQERDFPFWKHKTIRRAFDSLVQQGFLRTAQPDLARRDATKWYTIDFVALEPLARLIERQQQARRDAADASRRAGPGTPPSLPASHLLLNEPPLVIAVELARKVGLDEALLLQQIRYWLAEERRPLIRDGRRWVCPRDVDFFVPLTHRSPETLMRTLSHLEHAGLLQTSSRFNRDPGDRTKWFTIDFEALDALSGRDVGAGAGEAPREAQSDDLSPSNPTICPDPGVTNDRIQPVHLSRSKRRICSDPSDVSDRIQASQTAPSLKDSETDHETESEKQHDRGEAQQVVVDLKAQLQQRGVTKSSAAALGAAIPSGRIERQIAIYDWLRERDPASERLSPGRLRRMIEEDWAAPAGYRSAEEERIMAARYERERIAAAAQRQTDAAVAAQRRARRGQLLEEFGLTEVDQQRWAGTVAAGPLLPTPFRDALLRMPTVGSTEPAVIILPDQESLVRAQGAGHRATRATIAARLARLCQRPTLEVIYFDAPMLRVRLRSDTDGAQDRPETTAMAPPGSEPPGSV